MSRGDSPDEQALIRTARRGGLDAFNALVLTYQDSVYSLAVRIMSDPASAADIGQTTFITAYRRLATYQGGSFRAWLFRIATNLCYDELRRRKRRPATSLEEMPDAEADDGPALPDPGDTPEQAMQRREMQNVIADCIRALGDDQRAVLVMSDVEEMDYQEIADATGANLGTVKSRLSRARANMRDCLRGVQELLPPAYRLVSDE